MLFKLIFICEEEDDFLREITIDADASFLDLNRAILNACQYPDDQITSFYTCNDDWEPKEQITREDMGVGSADQDIYIMEQTTLRDFIREEDQKLMYVFDPFNDRMFYIKVAEVITGKNLAEPICSRSTGAAPQQIQDMNENLGSTDKFGFGDDFTDDDVDNFYGSDNFDQEDFDPEGFEIEEH